MIIYLLKSILCLGLLLAFYFLFLEREKMHRFNRFYLLGGVMFSLLIPLYTIPLDAQPQDMVEQRVQLEGDFMGMDTAVSSIFTGLGWLRERMVIWGGIYLLVMMILLFRFGRNLMGMIRTIRTHPTVVHQTAQLVLIPEPVLPHTFLNYIFIHEEEYMDNRIEPALLTHELAHVSQRHTLDILLVELLQLLFWFNPCLIFLKKAIRLNHEFLADQATIHQHTSISDYQKLLLSRAGSATTTYLATSFNYSLTKKRLLMMSMSQSKPKIVLKQLAVFPLLIGLAVLFTNKISAQTSEQNQGLKQTAVPQPVSVKDTDSRHQGESTEEGELKGEEYEKPHNNDQDGETSHTAKDRDQHDSDAQEQHGREEEQRPFEKKHYKHRKKGEDFEPDVYG
ncbi:MAG: M56 family metallopeptidase [Bacteroidota bacterium]